MRLKTRTVSRTPEWISDQPIKYCSGARRGTSMYCSPSIVGSGQESSPTKTIIRWNLRRNQRRNTPRSPHHDMICGWVRGCSEFSKISLDDLAVEVFGFSDSTATETARCLEPHGALRRRKWRFWRASEAREVGVEARAEVE